MSEGFATGIFISFLLLILTSAFWTIGYNVATGDAIFCYKHNVNIEQCFDRKEK